MTSPTPPVAVPVPLGVEARIRLRRAWASDWERVNPILRDTEPGYDKTNNMIKIGDGVTPWKQLPYLDAPKSAPSVVTGNVAIDSAMSSHVSSPTPHPAYDSGQSLLLLYQNAKV